MLPALVSEESKGIPGEPSEIQKSRLMDSFACRHCGESLFDQRMTLVCFADVFGGLAAFEVITEARHEETGIRSICDVEI